MAKRYNQKQRIDEAKSIIRILAEDVLAALRRIEDHDEPSARRNLVRAVFAAVDGISWTYRNHIIDAAKNSGVIDADTLSVLSETMLSVSDAGKIHKQARYLSLTATIRLVSRIAERFVPDLSVDFSTSDWAEFKMALAIRHRLTHPKFLSDLVVEDTDVRRSWGALTWLLRTVEMVMAKTNAQSGYELELLKDFLKPLQAGEQWALDLYNQAAETTE